MTRSLNPILAALLPLAALASEPEVDAPAARIADRAAIERVYYAHRLGNKPPFEQALPRETIRQMVRLDLNKEAALKNLYGLEPKPEWIAAEVRRIDAQSQAPDVLAEIRTALGNDPARFALAVARPIVVDRELRRRFESDASLHAEPRRQAEVARRKVRDLAQRREPESWPVILQTLREAGVGTVTEVTWQFGAIPESTKSDPRIGTPGVAPVSIKTRSRKYSIEAAVRFAEQNDLENSRSATDHGLYFDDLSGELQGVLHVQLRNRGDVSAVVETPAAFLLFVARDRTPAALTAAALVVPKRSLEQWLAQQKD